MRYILTFQQQRYFELEVEAPSRAAAMRQGEALQVAANVPGGEANPPGMPEPRYYGLVTFEEADRIQTPEPDHGNVVDPR